MLSWCKIGDADITFGSLESAFPVLSVTASSEGSERGVSNRNRRSGGGLSVPSHPQDFNYKRYLASREWALLKERIRMRSDGWCERCHAGPHEDTHHLTYERIGHEKDEDLLGVCRACHEWLSAKSTQDPLTLAFLVSERFTPETAHVSGATTLHLLLQTGPDQIYSPEWQHERRIFWQWCMPGCQWCQCAQLNMSDFSWAQMHIEHPEWFASSD